MASYDNSTYEEASPRGRGRAVLAGVLLCIAGILNVIYGLAAIDNSSFFVANAHFVVSDLNTWGWVTLILGVLQLLASFSIWRAGLYGLFFGIVVGSLAAIAALMSISAFPAWAIALFAIDLFIVWGLVQYTADTHFEVAD